MIPCISTSTGTTSDATLSPRQPIYTKTSEAMNSVRRARPTKKASCLQNEGGCSWLHNPAYTLKEEIAPPRPVRTWCTTGGTHGRSTHPTPTYALARKNHHEEERAMGCMCTPTCSPPCSRGSKRGAYIYINIYKALRFASGYSTPATLARASK